MLSNLHFLWKVEKESSFAGIEDSSVVETQITSSVLSRQIDIESGMSPLFKIHSSVTASGSFFFFFHLIYGSIKSVPEHFSTKSTREC